MNHNYDRTFLSNAEIISAFFTNVFVNKLYIIALAEFRDDKHKSITDAFKRVISNYAQGISRNYKHYKSVVSLLHAYYQDKTRYSTIVFSDFEDNILKQFIPEEYYHNFTSGEKDKTLYNIIIKVVHGAHMELLKPDVLSGIIDDRRDNTYALILKDKIIDNLSIQHEEYYAKFAKRISEGNHTVSLEVAQKLKAALVEETKKRCEIESEKEKAISIIRQLVDKLKVLQSQLDAKTQPTQPQPPPTQPQSSFAEMIAAVQPQPPAQLRPTVAKYQQLTPTPAPTQPLQPLVDLEEAPAATSAPATKTTFTLFDENMDYINEDIGFGG